MKLPTLDGLTVYPEPLDRAPPRVREALASLSAVRAHHLAPPPDTSFESISAWVSSTYTEYLREHAERVRALEAIVGALRANRDGFIAALLVALAYDDFYRTVAEIPVPDQVVGDEVLAEIYREAVTSAAAPLARRAGEAYDACAQRAAALPSPLRAWADQCRERGHELRRTDEHPSSRPPTASSEQPKAT